MSSLPDFEPAAARAPTSADRAEIRALAAQVGAHGVYVGNDLARDANARALSSRGIAFFGRDAVLGFAWFGTRGNLIVLAAPDRRLDAQAVARAVDGATFEWRIALGPEPVLAALAALGRTPPLLLRRQLYYTADAAAVLARSPDADVRPARPADLDSLVQATLELNRVDLKLDPSLVSRRWVRQSASERVRSETTFVIGPEGSPYAKLDVGSQGAAGVVVEGVFTVPAHRGTGCASRLVHAVCHQKLAQGRQVVCLHVAESNLPARRCYEKAGMHAAQTVGLLLRS